QCNKHESRNLDFCTRNIQEWCDSCSEISYFKQVVTNHMIDNNIDYYEKQKIIEIEKYCKSCGKFIYQQIPSINNNTIEFNLCSDCYQISSEWVESTLINKKVIPILYLPWWDTFDNCIACDEILEFNSDCEKWCSYCSIFYIGCRYCLTT